jgi:hypothetical protein
LGQFQNRIEKFTATEKVWRVWVGTKKKYFVAATIKCAYSFPKSKKTSLACKRVWHLPKHVVKVLRAQTHRAAERVPGGR